MNNLNSVLLEGIIDGTLTLRGRGKTKRCSFGLSSLRYVMEGKSIKKQETRVGVMIRGKSADVAVEQARNGRGVRVVGRLANVEQGGGIYIEAEHVEYRPEPKEERE
jgi:single-stranded DNA-binding protein